MFMLVSSRISAMAIMCSASANMRRVRTFQPTSNRDLPSLWATKPVSEFLLQHCEDTGNPVGVAHDVNVVQEGQQPLVILETTLNSFWGGVLGQWEQSRHRRVTLLTAFGLGRSVDLPVVILPSTSGRRPIELWHEKKCWITALQSAQNLQQNLTPIQTLQYHQWTALSLMGPRPWVLAARVQRNQSQLPLSMRAGMGRWLAQLQAPNCRAIIQTTNRLLKSPATMCRESHHWVFAALLIFRCEEHWRSSLGTAALTINWQML